MNVFNFSYGIRKELKEMPKYVGKINKLKWIARTVVLNLIEKGETCDSIKESAQKLFAITQRPVYLNMVKEAHVYKRIQTFIIRSEYE